MASAGRERIVGIALIILCQSFQSLVLTELGLFLPQVRQDLALSFTQAGTFAAASTLVYALMQIPSGYLADRLGPRRLFLAGIVGTNLFAFVFAFTQAYWQALPLQAASGFCRALAFTPGLLLVAGWFPPNRRATAMGLFIAGSVSSSIWLNAIGPFLVDPFGWRALFVAFAVVGLILAVAFHRFGGNPTARSKTTSEDKGDALSLFREPAVWLAGAIQYVRLAAYQAIAFWLPTLLVEEKGEPLRMAGLLIAVGAALTAPSNFLGGYISDRLNNPLLVIGGSLAVVGTTSALLVNVDQPILLVIIICANALFAQLYFGPLFSVPLEIVGTGRAGLVSGFANFFANMGAFTFTYTLGAAKDVTGSFQAGFYALSVLSILGIVCAVALGRRRRVVLARSSGVSD